MEEPPDILAVAESPTATPADGDDERGAYRRQWFLGVIGFVVVAVALGGLFFRVPYVALVPGAARDTEPLIEVEGIDAFPSEGELLFTTVRVRQRPNIWEYLWLQVDDDSEVVPEELILGDRTPEQNRQFNLELMNDSKSIAIAVALEELGYDAVTSDGVVIVDVQPGTPADGILVPGDTVVAIDANPVNHTGDLVALLAQVSPGDSIGLTVEPFPNPTPGLTSDESTSDKPDSDDSIYDKPDSDEVARHKVTVVLGAKEEDPDAAFLGVVLSDRVELQRDFGFLVDIDSGSVGGPSAGLAFTLAVLDQLTEGELTGGTMVAVTGTIDAGGRVGTVGGVQQKTAAVRDLGVEVFIVPAGLGEDELEKIEERAGDDLDIIPVATLQEALDALGGLGGEVDAVEEYAAANLS